MIPSILYVASMDMEPDRDSHWVKAFTQAGFETNVFSTSKRLGYDSSQSGKVKRRLHIGKNISELRRQLIEEVKNLKPDWVHFRLPMIFDRSTISAIKDECPLVTEYCNDDPFSPLRVKWYWRLFHSTIPLFDAHFIYRANNHDDFKEHGARHVLHAAPFFVPSRHNPPQWKDGEYEH